MLPSFLRWGSSDTSVHAPRHMPHATTPYLPLFATPTATSTYPLAPLPHNAVRPTIKRKLPHESENECDNVEHVSPPVKRARLMSEQTGAAETTAAVPLSTVASVPPTATLPSASTSTSTPQPTIKAKPSSRQIRDVIETEFGLEILVKHNELRLINQELARCQIALEQLRRCHLIPYPISCPTPSQMLDISSGKGPALQPQSGEPVPQWAPPFGVVDGPYARHYAKWLIPDPKFDGIIPPSLDSDASRSRGVPEGRTTRKSFVDPLGQGRQQRGSRGVPGQKLQSLSNGYPQPKEKAGPCILKRADGKVVKLVCRHCHRDNFSSTQGFINHCRIAHREEYKSHEEAATVCGHPVDGDDSVSVPANEEKPSGNTASASRLVHPFTRPDMTEQQAYASLLARLKDGYQRYVNAGHHVSPLPSIPAEPKQNSTYAPSGEFVGAAETPYLSQFMKSKQFNGNLSDAVRDAKIREDLGDDTDMAGDSDTDHDSKDSKVLPSSWTTGVMRVPARTTQPASMSTTTPPTLDTSRSSYGPSTEGEKSAIAPTSDEMDIDGELSPNTVISNNAPSLVSDDGEYDDSDDGSSDSDTGDSPTAEPEIAQIEEDHEAARGIRHRRSSSGVTPTTMRFKKEEKQPETFVRPVDNKPKARTIRNKRQRR